MRAGNAANWYETYLWILHMTHFLPVCLRLNSVGHPFVGDYVRLRHNQQWKKICAETNDQYVVFADIINKIARSSGKVCITI